MPRRINEQSRTRRQRERKPVVFIICEGSETEIRYFRRFRSRLSLVEVRPFVSQHKSALSLVEHAKDVIKQEPYYPEDGDQVWCVFDRDCNTNEELRKAQALAQRQNYKIAFSNPCFEVWFLLHFIDQHGHLEDANAVLKLLDSSNAILNYRKNGDYYDILHPLEEFATTHANALIKRHTSDKTPLISRNSNPCTTVVFLVEYLRERRFEG